MTKKIYYIIFFLSFLYLLNVSFDRIKENPRAVIWSDCEGYYVYLPGVFILKDFHKLPAGSMWPYYNEQGEFVNKFTCGVAYFELPFFGIGYLISKLKGVDTNDYFNPIYCKSIAFGGLLITFLGLLFLYKALIRDYKPQVVWWVIPAIYFGTNLFHYSTKEMGMSHSWSFFLFAILLYHIPKYLEKPGFMNSVILGGILGWIVLIRPTNIIISLLILLYNVYSIEALRERIRFFIRNYKSILLIALAAFIMFIPQMMYWKEMTGHWFYYSYSTEKFIYWNKPKILAVLFDVQNGLFLYTPLAILILIGIWYGWKVKNFQSPALLLIFVLITYAFASWWVWWFGGAFGHRSYVEYYAVFSIPLAGLIDKVFSSPKKWVQILFQFLLIVLMVYSVRLSFLYNLIGGPWDGADWRWNLDKYKWIMSHFFRTQH